MQITVNGNIRRLGCDRKLTLKGRVRSFLAFGRCGIRRATAFASLFRLEKIVLEKNV